MKKRRGEIIPSACMLEGDCLMKEIKAVIQPHRLLKIRDAFWGLPRFPGMTVTKAEGCGYHELTEDLHPSIKEELTDFSPKVRLEIIAADEEVEGIVDILRAVAFTGQRGDGLIWVTPVEVSFKSRPSE
jgi:nitrogen regulatory protein P-II 1